MYNINIRFFLRAQKTKVRRSNTFLTTKEKKRHTNQKKLIKGKRLFLLFFRKKSHRRRSIAALDSFSRQRTGNSRVDKFSLLCSSCLFDRRAHFEERAGNESERERHFAASLLPRDWKEKRIRRTLGRRS